MATVDHDLALVLEINCDLTPYVRLDLSKSPIGFRGMAHKHPRLEQCVHTLHIWPFPPTLENVVTPDPGDLTGLIGSRICHDLISPIGAIGNGLELLQMHGGESDELSLVSESCRNANARIKFFRIAFGAATVGQSIPGQEIAGILAEAGRWGRFVYRWSPMDALDRREARLACLALLCVEAAMPAGGTISTCVTGHAWTIHGTGRRIAAKPEQWDALASGHVDFPADSASVQVPLLVQGARDLGRKLRPRVSESRVEISF